MIILYRHHAMTARDFKDIMTSHICRKSDAIKVSGGKTARILARAAAIVR